jgi:phospholipid transport system substrate-binding protein
MRRRRLILAAGLLLLSATGLEPRRAWAEDAQALVSDFGDKAITLIRDGKIAPDDRQRQFRTLVDRYFDMPAIAGFVLARFWKGVDEGERVEFISALEGQIVEAYLGRFKGYAGETFAVKPGRRQKDSTMVPSSIVHADGSPPMSVDWTVQDSPKGLRIRDVSVSGVSMALTYRDEFSAVMQRNNGKIGPLITALRAVADAQRGE